MSTTLNISNITNLNGFEIKEVIGGSEDNKSIFLLAKLINDTTDSQALILAESGLLTTRTYSAVLSNASVSLEKQNDIYYSYSALSPSELKIDVVYPATEKAIAKYRFQSRRIVRETMDDYVSKTLPYIASLPSSRIDWVYNILDGKAEQDDIIYQDPDPTTGFVLLPDFKWNKVDISSLYVLAIVNVRGLASVRDLTTTHLPLLHNVKSQSIRAVADKYNVKGDQLRLYVHYLPSFFHLHIHVTHIQYTPHGNGIHIGKAILLDDIISNITMFPAYYQVPTRNFLCLPQDHHTHNILKKMDLTFTLGEREELYSKYFNSNN